MTASNPRVVPTPYDHDTQKKRVENFRVFPQAGATFNAQLHKTPMHMYVPS